MTLLLHPHTHARTHATQLTSLLVCLLVFPLHITQRTYKKKIDYWIWDVLDQVSPRVVVVETQELWGPRDRFVIKNSHKYRSHSDFSKMGASLGAFRELARKRGYRLVGCHNRGYNAFFVREDAVEGGLDAIFGTGEYAPEGCFGHVDSPWRNILQQRRDKAILQFGDLWVDPVTMETAAELRPKRLWSLH